PRWYENPLGLRPVPVRARPPAPPGPWSDGLLHMTVSAPGRGTPWRRAYELLEFFRPATPTRESVMSRTAGRWSRAWAAITGWVVQIVAFEVGRQRFGVPAAAVERVVRAVAT